MIEIFDKCHCQIYIINALITFAPATTLEIGIGRRPGRRGLFPMSGIYREYCGTARPHKQFAGLIRADI